MHEGVPREYKEQRARTRPEECDEDQKRFLRPRDQRLVAKAQSATVQEQKLRRLKSPTLRRAWPRDGPEAAICVQGIDVQCVLQFTLIHAAGCALHRRTSRVIHRSKLCVWFFFSYREFARVLALKATIFFFENEKRVMRRFAHQAKHQKKERAVKPLKDKMGVSM